MWAFHATLVLGALAPVADGAPRLHGARADVPMRRRQSMLKG